MSRQSWAETVTWETSSGTPVTNTTTETILFPNKTIPANYMQDGRALILDAFGQWSTGTGPPTLGFWLRWNGVAGTVLCTSALCTTVASTTAAGWMIRIIIQTRTNGASGTLMANGVVMLFAGVAGTVASATGEGLVTPMTAGGVLAPAAVTVDLTADTPISLTAKWSASSTSHTITGLNYTLTSAN